MISNEIKAVLQNVVDEKSTGITNTAYYEIPIDTGNRTIVVEVNDIIRGAGLNYWLGSACAYLLQAGRKDQTIEGTVRDLLKCIYYIAAEVVRMRKRAV